MWNEQQNQHQHQHQHQHHAHTTSTSTTNAPPLFSQIPQQSQSHGQTRLSKSAPCSPLKPLLSKRPTPPARSDSFHVIHKVPVGDTPYVKAKHVQLVDKDPNRAIALFWAAINAGDRVDSALKDMAIVMKQQNRPEEAIEAIKSLRYRCSDHAQESLDNVLLDLYKRCGRLDDQIALLKHKLHLIHQGLAFNGRRTKTARSQGKKFQVSIEQEATRLLGNLGWAYMQQSNFIAAEAVYRKALSIEPDNNKVCNLGICLMKQGRLKEAKAMLKSVKPACGDSPWGSDSHLKSFDRAQQMLQEMEGGGGGGGGGGDMAMASSIITNISDEDLFTAMSAEALSTFSCKWNANQNPINDISDLSGALFATSGFGPSSSAAAAGGGGGAAGAMVSSSSSQRPPLPPPPSSIASCKGESMVIPQTQQQAAAQQGDTMAMAMAFLNQNQNQSLPLLASAAAVPAAMNGRWEEEDAEHGFGDENKTDHPHHSHHHRLLPRQSTNWHAESLRVKLEKVVMVSNNSSNSNNAAAVPSRKSTTASSGHGNLQMKRSNSSSSMTPLMNSSPSSMNWGTQTLLGESNGSLLNSAALPFVAAPRSSSSSGFGASSCPNTTCKVVSSSSENQEKKKVMASCSSSRKSSSSSHSRSPSLQNLVLPDRSGATPEHAKKSCCKSLSFLMDKQEAHGSNNAISNGGDDAWSSLGFIQADSHSPLCTIATVLRKRSTSSLSSVTAMSPLQAPAAHAEEKEEEEQDEADNGEGRAAAGEEEDDEQEEVEEDDDDFQRRLQVFVEMTLPV